ncbi:MAG TPA: nucleoside-diphosphate sugar epimerase/dehydratase [Longimicrobiales bacterium]|nr:nucleoside-diphosphate sugar epimerase/dehydratase [Longimicrobiales bacterium]
MRRVLLAWAHQARRRHRGATLLLYAVVTSVGYTFAFLLRFGWSAPAEYASLIGPSLLPLVAIRATSFAALRLHRTTWRFAGVADVLRLGVATLVGSAVFYGLSMTGIFGLPVPRLVILLESGITANLTAAVWLLYRAGYEFGRTHSEALPGSKAALIIGAGEAGHLLAREIQRSPVGYRLLGFVDDDPELQNLVICGVEVLGTVAELDRIAKATGADELLISTNWSDQQSLRKTIEACQRTGLSIKLLPVFADVVKGDGLLAQLRAVKVEDLLGRDPVQLALPELAMDLQERSVLITGAAGSIGSELSRQVALHGPSMLVLFDQDETQLFYLNLELHERHPDLTLVPIVGDITDPVAVEHAFRHHHPDRVFHAAAYKHVTMMETNVREAIRNNVLGTRTVATIAGAYGAEKFVLVSTDKAVRPCSVMGATKRLSELVVLELQTVYPDTAYCGVRFGNVLGSNGSVLPIFERRLAAGLPLTVTHPEVTRYFMTIPEAVQLILQASLLPDIRGQLAMLEMGDPIRIVDLAQNFLRLAGRGDGNSIVFTGLRPGERLHEELVAPDESTIDTAIPKVKIVVTPHTANDEIRRLVGRWALSLDSDDELDALRHLQRHFPELRFNAVVAVTPLPGGGGPARRMHASGGGVVYRTDPEIS